MSKHLPPRDLPAGPGHFLVSSGAESLDPDSMLEEEDVIPVKSQDSSSSRVSRPILSLTLLSSTGSHTFVAGLVHRWATTDMETEIIFECLMDVALDLIDFPWSPEPLTVEKLEVQNKETMFMGASLFLVGIEECAGSKALVKLVLKKPDPSSI